MKIFITGIAGFLGSNLADYFINQGHEVSGCDNFIGGYADNINPKVKFSRADCVSFKEMDYLLKEIKPDVIYHCAALAYEGLSVFSPAQISESIYQSTISVLSAGINNGIKRFVYTSSMARYGSLETPFKEEQECKPQDPYGISKYSAELVVANLCNVHNVEYVIAVPHNIIGPRQKYDDPFRNVASIMINRMLQGNQPIIYGDGSQKRCFSFVDDCVWCLGELATNKEVVGEVINIGPDEEFITINELAQTIAKLLNFDLAPIYVGKRPQEVKLATCCSDKARKLLGYETNVTLEKGLLKMIEYIKKRGVKDFRYHLPIEIDNELVPETWKERLI